jgi:hypothetical protein
MGTMSREEFINNLRSASQALRISNKPAGLVYGDDLGLYSVRDSTELWLAPWLTTHSVNGFNPADFTELSDSNIKDLTCEVIAFQELAEQAKEGRTTKTLIKKARSHLETVIATVRKSLLDDWLSAQASMLEQAKTAARLNDWYAHQDEKEVSESLLGSYKAPRLRLKSQDLDVVFDPVARFGSDGRGVIDLVTMPNYETSHYITLKDDVWWIAAANEPSLRHKRFSKKTLVDAISRVSHR